MDPDVADVVKYISQMSLKKTNTGAQMDNEAKFASSISYIPKWTEGWR